MLPDEEGAGVATKQGFRDLFEFASELHELAVRPLDGSMTVTTKRGLRPWVFRTAIGLYVKACKQHRSIQILAEKGMGQDALALARSIFETMMAIHFLLRHRVHLRENVGTLDEKPVRVRGKPLTTWFRTILYHANVLFEQERTGAAFSRRKRFKRLAHVFNTTRLPADVTEAQRQLGPEWTRRLRRSKTYAGVSLKDLAESLGHGSAYASHYRFASWAVHATMLGRYVISTPEGVTLRLAPDGVDVPQAIGTANICLFLCLYAVNQRFGLGLKAAIDSMKPRVRPKQYVGSA